MAEASSEWILHCLTAHVATNKEGKEMKKKSSGKKIKTWKIEKKINAEETEWTYTGAELEQQPSFGG